MHEMFAWYIDNNAYISKEFIDQLIADKEAADAKGITIRNVILNRSPDRGNPSAAITGARNAGLLGKNEEYSDALRLYKAGIYPLSMLLFELAAKRNVAKSEPIPMKPLVCLCKVFSYMNELGIAESERFITTAEVYEYISVQEDYSGITKDLVKRIVDERVYTREDLHVPDKRVTVRSEVYLSMLFSMLCGTPVFKHGGLKTVLSFEEKYIELINYIAKEGERISNAPIAEGRDNSNFYDYCMDIDNGIMEIISEVPFKTGIAIPKGATKDIFDYLFGVQSSRLSNWDDYFEHDCAGMYRIFYPIRWIALVKVFLQDKTTGEYLLDYAMQASNYIDSLKEGKLMIELPFENTNHTDISELTEGAPTNNEEAFKEWLAKLRKANGEPYSQFTRNQYISAMRAAATEFVEELEGYKSIFDIGDAKVFARIAASIKNSEKFDAFNKARGNGAMSACMGWYQRFLIEIAEKPMPIRYTTGLKCDFARNRILFGAPGTGKSFTLNEEKDTLLKDGGEYERVTFHPDYSYANFVGTYKPVPVTNDDENSAITYSYVPGPFMRVYVKALQNSRTDNPKPYLLVIEEINRANVAAVFGDVFQLLDRDEEEKSQYPIQASEDIKKYLAIELGGTPDQYAEIRIPDNMFIWASMNSADQGVFPMDTAFKRRWDFKYMGIDHGAEKISGKKVILGEGEHKRLVEWNALREAINEELTKFKINEDKLMGPFFLSKKVIPEAGEIDRKTFIDAFKNKVIMYLFDDAAKQKRPTLFSGCEDKSKNQYSKICAEFEDKGVFIFCDTISNQFIDVPKDDNE